MKVWCKNFLQTVQTALELIFHQNKTLYTICISMVIILPYYSINQGRLLVLCLLMNDHFIFHNIGMRTVFWVWWLNNNNMKFRLFLLTNKIRRLSYFIPVFYEYDTVSNSISVFRSHIGTSQAFFIWWLSKKGIF